MGELVIEELCCHDMVSIDQLSALFPTWKRKSILKKLKDTERGKDKRIVAKIDGKMIGHLKIVFGKGLHKHRTTLTSLMVLPEHRKKGIATAITKFALKNLPEKTKLVLLEVDEKSEPAINLYKKLGFKEYGYLKKASILHGKIINNLLLEKSV